MREGGRGGAPVIRRFVQVSQERNLKPKLVYLTILLKRREFVITQARGKRIFLGIAQFAILIFNYEVKLIFGLAF